MIKNVKLKTVGVTFANEDTGKSRQEIIKLLCEGSKLWLEREPQNKFDSNAIKVVSELGQVGYIGKDYASILAGMLDKGTKFNVSVAEIAEYKNTYYLHIMINEVEEVLHG